MNTPYTRPQDRFPSNLEDFEEIEIPVMIFKETGKAYLLGRLNKKRWVPKSVCKVLGKLDDGTNRVNVLINEWFDPVHQRKFRKKHQLSPRKTIVKCLDCNESSEIEDEAFYRNNRPRCDYCGSRNLEFDYEKIKLMEERRKRKEYNDKQSKKRR